MTLVLTPIVFDDNTELMPIEEFKHACRTKDFIDYDGFGCLATATHEARALTIRPSQVLSPDWEVPDPVLTYVNWFNR